MPFPRLRLAAGPRLDLLAVLALVLRLSASAAQTESFYDEHVVFDNSLTTNSCFHSEGSAVAPSQLELVDGRFPIESAHFVSPPNALRLHWKSRDGGDWRMILHPRKPNDGRPHFDGDSLSLWCFSAEGLSPAESPRLALQDANDLGSATIGLLDDHGLLPAQQWVHLRIPFARFKSPISRTDDLDCDPVRLAKIWFFQSLEDSRDHTLYIDDVQVDSWPDTSKPPPPAPVDLAVQGFERHFDLTWKSPKSPSSGPVLRYEIQRSFDNSNFISVASQQGHLFRCEDFVGAPPQRAWYRVRAVDPWGNASPFSAPVSAVTHLMTGDELMDMTQEGCFRYYWEGAHPHAGMALEITPGDENLVAVGASGFGIMALVVGAERHFVSRDDCAQRLVQITRFLQHADRFHGAFPHFLDGNTGRVRPYFGKYDDGGDLVETAFLMEGLLTARQYFDRDNPAEREIRQAITSLWRDVEWDWYRRSPTSDFLYWHWSPDYGWHINHPLVGWNETMIVYLLAIASPTHPVPASLYYSGWAGQSDTAVRYRQNWSRTTVGDHYTNGGVYHGWKLDVGEGTGADLFFTQFSYMGFDPRGKRDRFTDYFQNNRNIALINHAYCADDPLHWKGYGTNCWGLSAGVNSGGGRAQPRDDNGTICCSAALGSFPYTPVESMAALKHFYRELGPKLWGIYGFFDGFNESQNWFEPVWMGLNQAVVTVMIENYRTGLVWKNFMANPEIAPALRAIGFQSDASTPALILHRRKPENH